MSDKKDQRIEKRIDEFRSNLRGKTPNTKRLYVWQARRFLQTLQDKKVKPDELHDVALNYLRHKRRTKSRSDFLQSCSAVSILLAKVLRRPLASGQVEKLQSYR